MKQRFLLILPILAAFIFQGCLKDKMMKTYTILTPVYKEKNEVYSDIKSNPAVAIEKPGKIFIYGNYIFLNDIDKGVHIIDNSDPLNPVSKAFINIPGNLDIAVKGNTLYADLYTDLVVVDISNPLDARFVKFIPDIFPARNYTNGFLADKSRVIVGWTRKDTTMRIENYCTRCDFLMAAQLSSGPGPLNSAGGAPVGVAGSMARFAISQNYLYTVNNTNITSFNITNEILPVQTATQQVGWNIETIFPFKDKLFIGSRTGMFIYSLANPAVPQYQGQFAHMQSCDPVIADDNYAYVTLRSGNACGDLQSQLNIINISNVLAPSLVKTYSLSNPYGLSRDGNILFVCDGSAGLKMYDAANPLNLVLKNEISNLDAYDVIAYGGNLLLVAKDGLYQYGYTSSTLSLKSKIAINRK